jgi:hypothetical protein
MQARAFAEAAYQRIPVEERPKTLTVTSADAAGAAAAHPDQHGTVAAIEAALQHVPNDDLDFDSWIRIGLAIKGALGDAGWPLFEAWSAMSTKDQPSSTAKSWHSFKPDSIGAGTIYRLAFDRGWIPAAHLQLNGDIAMNDVHPAQGLLDRLKRLDSFGQFGLQGQSAKAERVQQALAMLAEGFSPSTPVSMQFRAQFPTGQALIDFTIALDLSYAGDWKEIE